MAHWRLLAEAGGSRLLVAVGFVLMAVVFIALVVHLWRERPATIVLLALVVGGSVAVEWYVLRRRVRP